MKPQKQFPYRDNQALDKDITTLYDWISRLDITTTAPNGSKTGFKGEGILYNNSGKFELWVNTDGATAWQNVMDINVVFTGSSGLAYGHMWTKTNFTITISGIGTEVEVDDSSNAFTGTEVNNVTFNDHYLSVDKAGRYLIIWGMGIQSTATIDVIGGIAINSTTFKSEALSTQDLAANTASNLASSAILNLSAGDQVSLFLQNDTDTTDIVVNFLNLSVIQVGG